ncbi:MAG: alanine racemase [Candidatus Komeilibacteria bacterium]|nr:alanine racemase [Candidatus Komeilibacteria bacterium]
MIRYLSWVEIDKQALISNLKTFRRLIGPRRKLLIPIKANAYGHGLVEIAKIAAKNGADFFGVNSIQEANILRHNKITKPVLVMGYTLLKDLPLAVKLTVSLIVYNEQTIRALGRLNKPINIHVKLETGTNRQGIMPDKLLNFVKLIKKYPKIKLEGLYTHFANIEDTTNHTFAFKQLATFNQAVADLEKNNIHIPLKHTACSAAAILFPETYFDLVRPGISTYGLWSSKETRLSAGSLRRKINLKPVLAWKSVIAQIKEIKTGECVGYGCTEKTARNTKLAIIPVGYWDGYDRGLHHAQVIIHGQRARIFGRVCMNMMMVDVTDIKNIAIEDEVVLLGQQGRESITAEELADQINTINYELVTRINPTLPRIII